MAEEPATTTYLVAEPFERAVKSLRKALTDASLKLAGELDMSSRIRQTLMIGVAPCRVFLITAPWEDFDQADTTPPAAALTPLHIVVSARGSQTEIHLLRALPDQCGSLNQATIDFFRRLQTRIARAVERVGMRSTFAV